MCLFCVDHLEQISKEEIPRKNELLNVFFSTVQLFFDEMFNFAFLLIELLGFFVLLISEKEKDQNSEKKSEGEII